MKRNALVLAAGKGTRMKTDLPKCAFPILKKPMIQYIVESIEKSVLDDAVVVVGHKKEIIQDILKDRVQYAVQEEQLGTGHAALMAQDLLKGQDATTLILLGDMPLIDEQAIDEVIDAHEQGAYDLTVVTTTVDDPSGYGRIIRDDYGKIEAIVEEVNCTPVQREIKEINTGIYAVNNGLLFKAISQIKKDAKKAEYYLTDIVEILQKDHHVGTHNISDTIKLMGVNDLVAISEAEKYLREQINRHHMLNGVSMINPETITIGHNVRIDGNVIINPNTTITGDSTIKAGAEIGPNTEIHNGKIDHNVRVRHSLIYDSTVQEASTIGPFAHLRNGTVIGAKNRIGNFVEVKKTTTGNETNAAHLAYLGDSEVGHNVNFGCGAITVNYDGKEKHKTKIGNHVFVGCNTNMVAPITIGDNVFIAAGSTVTEDVPEGSLAIARNRQINKADYASNLIKAKPKNNGK